MSMKQGLHGFKAFLVVVGSGVFVALIAVGLIFGVTRLFISTVSGSNSSEMGSSASLQTRGTISSLDPGSFDLCNSIENIQAFGSVSPVRLDDGSNFLDTELEDASLSVRTISNDCAWNVMVGGLSESEFNLSYESNIGSSRASLEEAVSSVDGVVEKISSEGEIGGVPGGSHYVYGTTEGEEVFAFVGVVKNTSFFITLKNRSRLEGESLESDYRSLVRQIIPDIRERLDRVVPD